MWDWTCEESGSAPGTFFIRISEMGSIKHPNIMRWSFKAIREIYKAFDENNCCTFRADEKEAFIMSEITLREVCNLLGVTRRAVQGYEKAGLVEAFGKNKYGYLLYDELAVEKIKIIKLYQEFGFSVKEIKVLLQIPAEDYVSMMSNRLSKMKEELRKLEVNIEMMERMIYEKQS